MRHLQSLGFTRTHEWAVQEDADIQSDIITCGISHYVVEQLTDLIVLTLPIVGSQIIEGDPIGELESLKTVSDFYAPLTGEVIEVNNELIGDPAPLVDDPYGAGWLFKLRPFDFNIDLISYDVYRHLILKR